MKIKLIMTTMILVVFNGCHGYTCPHKKKVRNIHELLLLINLTIMYAVSYQANENIFSIVTNVMISLAFIQFCTIVLYHFLTYTCHDHCNVVIMLQTINHTVVKYVTKKTKYQNVTNLELLNVPECTYNYTEYRDVAIYQWWLSVKVLVENCIHKIAT